MNRGRLSNKHVELSTFSAEKNSTSNAKLFDPRWQSILHPSPPFLEKDSYLVVVDRMLTARINNVLKKTDVIPFREIAAIRNTFPSMRFSRPRRWKNNAAAMLQTSQYEWYSCRGLWCSGGPYWESSRPSLTSNGTQASDTFLRCYSM
jgi:hypothetical protein